MRLRQLSLWVGFVAVLLSSGCCCPHQCGWRRRCCAPACATPTACCHPGDESGTPDFPFTSGPPITTAPYPVYSAPPITTAPYPVYSAPPIAATPLLPAPMPSAK